MIEPGHRPFLARITCYWDVKFMNPDVKGERETPSFLWQNECIKNGDNFVNSVLGVKEMKKWTRGPGEIAQW